MSDNLYISYRDYGDEDSNRSLLCSIYESDIMNYEEREHLIEYKKIVALLEANEEKLQEIKNILRCGTNPFDASRNETLQKSANSITKQIELYEKKLIELEQTAPIQRILVREFQDTQPREEQPIENPVQETPVNNEDNRANNSSNYVLFQMFLRSLSLLCPMIMIDNPIWATCLVALFAFLPTMFHSPVPIFISYHAYHIVRPILYVWGLIATIQGNQDFFAIAFYILFGLQVWNIIKNLIFTTLIIINAITERRR